jgi:hypothetical protein
MPPRYMTSAQLRQISEKIPLNPLATSEIIASLARCELVMKNCSDNKEKYFARMATSVLSELGEQMLSLASHPELDKIVEDEFKSFPDDN